MPAEMNIVPLVGLGSIQFGMSPADVAAVLGQPTSESRSDGDVELYYDNHMNCFFDQNSKLFQIGATRRAKGLMLSSTDIFATESFLVLRTIERNFGNCYEMLGFIVFPEAGITLTGFHDGDESQKAMTLFPKGLWDKYRSEFTPISFLKP
jgi:hypothetical protein